MWNYSALLAFHHGVLVVEQKHSCSAHEASWRAKVAVKSLVALLLGVEVHAGRGER